MDHLADRLDAGADVLTTVERRVPSLGVPAAIFAAGEAGLPRRLGRELHARWSAVLEARAREAADAAARLADLAQSLRATAQSYAEADDAVARRIHRGA